MCYYEPGVLAGESGRRTKYFQWYLKSRERIKAHCHGMSNSHIRLGCTTYYKMYSLCIHFPSGQHIAHESALIFPNFIQQPLFSGLNERQIFSLLAFQTVCLNYIWCKAIPQHSSIFTCNLASVPSIFTARARRWTLNMQKMLFC